MELAPSSAKTAGDGLAEQNDEVISSKETTVEGSSSSNSLANGSCDLHLMNNGKPRPSAVRDFPKNIVPINCIFDASLSSAEEQQVPVSSKGTIEQRQIKDGLIISAEILSDIESDKEGKKSAKKLLPDQNLTKVPMHLPKQVQEERKKQASPGTGKPVVEKDVTAARTQKASAMLGAKKSAAIADRSQAEPNKVIGALQDNAKKTLTGKPGEKKFSINAATASVTKEMESKSNKEKIVLPERTNKMPPSSGKSAAKKIGASVSTVSSASSKNLKAVEAELSKQNMPTEKTGTKIMKAVEKKSSEIASAELDVGNTSQGEIEAMDIDKQEIDEERHISVKESEEKAQEGTVGENGKKLHPVKRKAGVRDPPEIVKHTKQIHAVKDVQNHSDQGLGVKKGKAATDKSKIDSMVKKKRPLEEPDPSDRSKKLAKAKPSDVAQGLGKMKESSSVVQEPIVTPKAVKPVRKSSTPSGSGKKVRQAAGKSSKPTNNTDLGDPRKSLLESLRLYDAVRRKYVQDEEKSGKKQKGSRADLQATTLLKKLSASRGVEKAQGSLPGLFVGDIFLFRTELSFARVHGPIQAGIEYLTVKESEYNDPVAISIISNVGQDSDDNGEELLYTGQGGRSADNKQIADQKLERGNLALDRGQKFEVPIRVIRGIKDVNSPTGKVYVYDGLYQVKESYTAKGSGGFDEFKFKLQRVPDQPGLGWDMFKLAADLKGQSPAARKDIVVADISKGKENGAICVENTVDDDKGPASFEYSTKVIYSEDVGTFEPSVGCNCKGACSASGSCSCFSKNGDELPYLSGGYLVRQKDYVFECGSKCSCSSTCRNRATERSSRFQLDVFKTADRGWGVRSLDIIPGGSFVCEYTGKLVADDKVEDDTSDRDHRLLTRRLPDTTPLWGDVPDVFTDRSPPKIMPDVGNLQLMIDANTIGNVARFINHSCSPNLFIQKVLSEHYDVRFPHFKLFAVANIPPLTELTLDYGHPSTEELASEPRCVDCLCGSSDCRGKLYL